MYRLLLHTVVIVLLAGCASQNKYIEPGGRKSGASSGSAEKGDTIVERAPAVVWQRLIAGAQKAGFIIENPSQTTWTMQLHYTGDPKDYIDCGRVISKVKTARGERSYDFPAAKAYQQYEFQQGSKLFLVDRRMNLDVRAALNLEAVAPSRTRVKLESEYVAIRDQSVQGGGAQPFALTAKVSFGASDGATFPDAATRCRATGKFESEIVGLARR